MEWLIDYGLFLAKAATVFLLVVLVLLIGFARRRSSGPVAGRLHMEDIGDKYRHIRKTLSTATDNPRIIHQDPEGRKAKRERKKQDKKPKPTIFVLDFVGDISASGVSSLREEISAAMLAARSGDEMLLRLDSPGGSVTGYGLVAAQLTRVRLAGIPLTVAINQVAASGGYLAACVANHIIAAPFAIIGSIGVVLQLPNLNRLLQEHHIDFEQLTAGRNKRNLSVFGKIDDEGRANAQSELEGIHRAFIAEVGRYRKAVDLKQVSEGDIWLASEAIELGLVDDLGTSDSWLIQRLNSHRLLHLQWRLKRKPLLQMLLQTGVREWLGAIGGGGRV